MNKIYKKVWNVLRGCFVAVSEAIGTKQARGKLTGVITNLCLLVCPISASALTTIDGDAHFNDLPRRIGDGPYDYVNTDVNVTGNFFYDSGKALLYVGCTSGSVPFGNITMTVGNNLHISSGYTVSVGHNHNRSQNVTGALIVHGNTYLDGSLNVGDRSSSNYAHSTASLIVDGTVFVSETGKLINSHDGAWGNMNLDGSVSIGTLDTSGYVRFVSGTVTSTYDDVIVRDGTFDQTANNTVWIKNSLTLLGGSLLSTDSLTVGAAQGKMAVGNSLTLAGTSLGNNPDLVQVGGSVKVDSNYSFETYTKSAGTLNNNAVLTLKSANLSGGVINNTGTIVFDGDSTVSDTVHGGSISIVSGNTNLREIQNVLVNVQGGNFEFYDIGKTNSLNISSGYARVNIINPAREILLSGGSLSTDFNQIFTQPSQKADELNVINLAALVPSDIRTVATELFQKYVPGEVSNSLLANASFTGGKLIITDVNLTETQRDDLTQAFKEQIFSRDSQANASPVALS